MTTRPWMPLYIGDYLADTGHLTTVEHGAYMLLIMHYWQKRGLPNDDAKLARICRMELPAWMDIRATIAGLFGEGWTHKRIDAEVAHAEDVSSKRKAAALQRHSKSTPNDVQTGRYARVAVAVEEDTPSKQEEASPRARLDALEAEAREAAGLERDTSPSPSLFDLSPLLALLDAGYSWHNDILPKLREAKARGQKGRTWSYYVPAITEGKAKNSAIQPRASPPPMRWLPADSPEWPVMDERSLRETGKHLRPLPSKAQMGKGAYVPLAWSGETGERA